MTLHSLKFTVNLYRQGDWKKYHPQPKPLSLKIKITLHLSSYIGYRFLYKVTAATAWCGVRSTEVGTRNVRERTSCPRKEAARRHWPCEWEQGGTEDSIRSEGNASLRHGTGSSLGKWGEKERSSVSPRGNQEWTPSWAIFLDYCAPSMWQNDLSAYLHGFHSFFPLISY